MREAEGGAMLLYMVAFFVGIIILFFAGIMAYTKAYKVKNRVIELIEANVSEGSNDCESQLNNNTHFAQEVNSSLKDMGYQLGSCPIIKDEYNGIDYKVCIKNKTANNGIYYKVTTYVHFDLPIISDVINIPVSGETKIMCKNYDY